MVISTQLVGKVLTVKLEGRFAAEQCRQFLKEVGQHLHGAANAFVIDFERISYLDSSALGALLMMREKANIMGKVISLSNCKGNVKTVFGIANFNKLFSIN